MEYSGRAGRIVHSEYLIGRFRVVFETGGGWDCACADFVKSRECRHTREAAGMRAAQADIKARVATGRSQFAPATEHRSADLQAPFGTATPVAPHTS
jgi:hypothetical protein